MTAEEQLLDDIKKASVEQLQTIRATGLVVQENAIEGELEGFESALTGQIDDEELSEEEQFNEELNQNLREDYRDAREDMSDMLKRMKQGFTTALEEALSTADAKQLTALASVLNAITATHEKRIALSDKYRDKTISIDKIEKLMGGNNKTSQNPSNQVNVQNNFYGQDNSINPKEVVKRTTEDVLANLAKKNPIHNRFNNSNKSKEEEKE